MTIKELREMEEQIERNEEYAKLHRKSEAASRKSAEDLESKLPYLRNEFRLALDKFKRGELR